MVFFWPAVVALNYHLFSHKPFLCGLASSLEKHCCKDPGGSPGTSGDRSPPESRKPALVHFFTNHFSFLILRHRVKIILVFSAVSIFQFVQLSRLEPEKSLSELLPPEHPVRQFGDLMRNTFVRGGSIYNTKVHMVFGFDKEPLDRAGLDTTGEGYGVGPDVVGTLGKVRWNPNFADYENIMRGLPCMIQLCDAAEVPDASRHTGGP